MNKRFAVLTAALVGFGFLFTGCQSPKGTYGEPMSNEGVISIGELLSSPKKYEGKSVKVSGLITQECPTGGWFNLKDNSGVVFVNLHPSNFSIPQAVGQETVAEGIVKREGLQVEVVGKGVELK